ncbi:MAG TPA: hypothetical protein VIG90_16085 [Pedomonas sp.]|uniref:hypothetical protein n=1 Tax=Pedomonas sp. TaxID=2976421 RepID=UPI002F4023EA
MIERQRLSEILDACGANPARWPDEEREAAKALLARDTELQAQARQEAVLDDWLITAWDAPAPRPQAMETLLAASRVTAQAGVPRAIAAQETTGRRERWLANGWAVGLAASIMALLMAVSDPAPQAQVEVTDSSVASLAFSTDLSEGWL